MALDVKVDISINKPIGREGFGIPLIFEENASADKPYAVCRNLAEVKEAGFADNTKVYKAANALFMQDGAPARIAVCATSDTASNWLDDVDNLGKEWRQLIVVSEGDEVGYAGIVTKIEATNNKVYFADMGTGFSPSFSVADLKRTFLFFVDATAEYPSPAAALVGATAGRDAGSFSYKNIIVKGIAPQKLTASEIEAIHAKGGVTFVTKAGDNVTTEGKVAGGEYLDIIDSQDYIVNALEYRTQKTLNSADKVSYDNTGITILENVCVGVMHDAWNNGIIATDENGKPMYSVDYGTREDTDEADRAARRFVNGNFSFTLAGAIHNVEVNGSIDI